MLSIHDVISHLLAAASDQNILILDACFSDRVLLGGSSTTEGEFRDGRAFGPIQYPEGIASLVASMSVYVMSSSYGDNLSYEFESLDGKHGDNYNHGVFTYYLLKSTDAPPPSAGVTLNDAYNFASKRVKAEVEARSHKQEPHHWVFGSADNLTWVRQAVSTAGVTGSP
jgi:uncharacterized caspase-like protein